ncbi:MAG: hypothetical protein Q8941_14200 [Bacteroidota bacterium]|nr:hypothetical protein [Bacteroidota bacterium]
MKKVIIAILSVLYLSTSSGAMVNLHYCMGRLTNWTLGHDKSDICSKCGMKKSAKNNNDCCKDEHKFLKNNSDQKTAESAFQQAELSVAALPASFIEIAFHDFPSLTEEKPVCNAPPRSNGVATYIRNRVFLI